MSPVEDGDKYYVAPFAGAWIEMSLRVTLRAASMVAPFAGAWIEISNEEVRRWRQDMSLPSRERGLKCDDRHNGCIISTVAPFTGAWIEIRMAAGTLGATLRRSLHGSVD